MNEKKAIIQLIFGREAGEAVRELDDDDNQTFRVEKEISRGTTWMEIA